MHDDFFFFFNFFFLKRDDKFGLFHKGDKARPNAPSLENECSILKNFELGNFFFLPEANDEDDDFLKNRQGMAKCSSLTINVNF